MIDLSRLQRRKVDMKAVPATIRTEDEMVFDTVKAALSERFNLDWYGDHIKESVCIRAMKSPNWVHMSFLDKYNALYNDTAELMKY